MKKLLPIGVIFVVISLFFWPFFSKLLLPIPADNIVGLYHPFNDFFAKSYTRGIPYKNYLLTDPIKQQYPWRELAISMEKKLQLPLWNPYSLSGTPLLANFQSAAFYPLNLLFFILPFPIGWSMLILLQPLLAALFLYLYLDNLKLSKWASILGAISFAFCGFFTAWLEWGTVTNAGIWVPLIFLCIDKLSSVVLSNEKKGNTFFWAILLIFSMASSFFAGHLQTTFYVFMLTGIYGFVQWIRQGKSKRLLYIYTFCVVVFALVISIQLFPTLQFISLSARELDQANWRENPGWFIPWVHLVQFVAPDFFGNPATINYWSIFNYGEFVGYVGIFPLLMVFIAICFRRDRNTLFFALLFFISLLFALPHGISALPFVLQIPFLSTAQPTRLLFIVDFSLAVLAALGFDYFIKNKRKIFMPLAILFFVLLTFWIFVLSGNHFFSNLSMTDLAVTKRNLYFPSAIFITIVFFVGLFLWNKKKNLQILILTAFLFLTVFDLFRFSSKFNPFIEQDFLFPETKTIQFLKQNKEQFRIMTSDTPVFPPNFSAIFRLQSIDGYDPLYLRRYAELIAVLERQKPDITPPFGFNRIIIPHDFNSKITDLLGVKYFLSRTEVKSEKLTKVFQEGKTRVYENPYAFPRVFFVQNIICAMDKQHAIKELYNGTTDLRVTAIVEDENCSQLPKVWSSGNVRIVDYSENRVEIETENTKNGFLVFIDSYYPTWHAKIYSSGNKIGREVKIYVTDFNFRGIIVPKGKNIIKFYNTLL